jgi:hypothetical protein
MPVLRSHYQRGLAEFTGNSIYNRDQRPATLYSQGPALHKIVLHIHNDERNIHRWVRFVYALPTYTNRFIPGKTYASWLDPVFRKKYAVIALRAEAPPMMQE